MATDVLVRHCRLRIARQGGWSWGPDPRALLRGVLLRLPQLLAARLFQEFPREADLVLTQPVRLRVVVSRDELATLAAANAAEASSAAEASLRPLLQRIDAELLAWAARVDLPVLSAPVAAAVPDEAVVAEPAPAALDPWGGAVMAVLAEWNRQGVLVAQLLTFSAATLSDWHEALMRTALPRRRRGTETPEPAAISLIAAEAAALVLPLPASPRAVLLRRIVCLVRATAQLGLTCRGADLLKSMSAHETLLLEDAEQEPMRPTRRAPDSAATTRSHVAVFPATTRQKATATAAAPATLAQRDIEVEVSSALPFLLLGPLARTGYLLTLRATFESAGIAALMPCFAVALARKVLAPPRRGWLRSEQDMTTARAFAGHSTDLPENQLSQLARVLTPHLGPLDATVEDVLARGHERSQPLVLREAPGGGWLLLDGEGLFVIAWAERIERLFARLTPLRDSILLLPDSPAAATAMQTLDDAGFQFVSDTAPGRGQAWRALHAPGQRFATNDRVAGDSPLLAAAQRLDGLGTDTDDMWLALVEQRPGLPVDAGPAVERSLGLVAALGLGTIAWSLWHRREPVTPLLTLERFGDFGARVSFRFDRIEVHLPLGRRFLDLEAAGLLADVAHVPWFDGRPLRFTRG